MGYLVWWREKEYPHRKVLWKLYSQEEKIQIFELYKMICNNNLVECICTQKQVKYEEKKKNKWSNGYQQNWFLLRSVSKNLCHGAFPAVGSLGIPWLVDDNCPCAFSLSNLLKYLSMWTNVPFYKGHSLTGLAPT